MRFKVIVVDKLTLVKNCKVLREHGDANWVVLLHTNVVHCPDSVLVGHNKALNRVEGKDSCQHHEEEVEEWKDDQLGLILAAALVDQLDDRRLLFLLLLVESLIRSCST